jgi:hypothetical protein
LGFDLTEKRSQQNLLIYEKGSQQYFADLEKQSAAFAYLFNYLLEEQQSFPI